MIRSDKPNSLSQGASARQPRRGLHNGDMSTAHTSGLPDAPTGGEGRQPRSAPFTPLAALAVDLLLVVLFVSLGQREHASAAGLPRLLVTASPFLLALLVMSAATRVWRSWDRVWPHGVLVWLGTVAGGMALRVAWDLGGAPVAFVVVATVVLGLLLLGRRAVSRVLTRRRQR